MYTYVRQKKNLHWTTKPNFTEITTSLKTLKSGLTGDCNIEYRIPYKSTFQTEVRKRIQAAYFIQIELQYWSEKNRQPLCFYFSIFMKFLLAIRFLPVFEFKEKQKNSVFLLIISVFFLNVSNWFVLDKLSRALWQAPNLYFIINCIDLDELMTHRREENGFEILQMLTIYITHIYIIHTSRI